MADVVDFPRGAPLTDIPGQLRELADVVERLGQGQVVLAIVVLETVEAEIQLYQSGEHLTQSQAVGVLTRAATQATLVR